METTATTIVKINPAEFGLEESKAAQIEAQFRPMLERMVELEKEFNEINALPEDDNSAPERAKTLRLKYVKVRTGTAEIHKAQKAFFLAGGRFVDGWKNAQLFASQGIEEKLSLIENRAEIKEQARIAALQKEREEALKPYSVENVETLSLGSMSDQVWANFLAGTKANFEAKAAAEKKAEEDRIERERIDVLHKQRKDSILDLWQFVDPIIKDRNFGEMSDDLWQTVVAGLKAEKDKADAAAKAKEAELAQAKADREKADAEAKAAADAAAKARAESDAAIKAEKDKADALAAELKAKADAEAKLAAETAAAEKKAKAAPDKEKLSELARQLHYYEMPEVQSEEAKAIITEAAKLLTKTAKYILDKSEAI